MSKCAFFLSTLRSVMLAIILATLVGIPLIYLSFGAPLSQILRFLPDCMFVALGLGLPVALPVALYLHAKKYFNPLYWLGAGVVCAVLLGWFLTWIGRVETDDVMALRVMIKTMFYVGNISVPAAVWCRYFLHQKHKKNVAENNNIAKN